MKVDKSLNDEQNLAVYSRGSSILVSAPAGSGKTKILVNRMMSLIEDDHVNVDSLLVLTFTKAAALEMKQRLTAELNKKIQSASDNQKVHLERQKVLLNDAYITNFHSFCGDLLRQYGHLIDMDTNFEIIDNADMIKNDIFEKCLDLWVNDPTFMDFYSTHYVDYNFHKFKDMIMSLDGLYHTIYDFDRYFETVKKDIYDTIINEKSYQNTPFASYMNDLLLEAYHDGYDSFLKLTQLCKDHGLDFFFTPTKTQPAIYDVLEDYYLQLKSIIDLGKLLSAPKVEIKKHRNASFKNVDEEIKMTYQKLIEKAKKTFNDIYDKCMPGSVDEVCKILEVSYQSIKEHMIYLKEFQEAFQSYKKERSIMDFNDLEQYALKLLDKQYGVSEILYHQFFEIMIDEYQDTNEIQENLILKIARFKDKEINRFMVGDMKQSIYRFRKADLDIFYDKYVNYGINDENKRIDLKFNYRSNKVVLDSINYIFNAIMDKRYGGLEYDNDPHAQLNYDFLRKEKCDTEQKKNKAIERIKNDKRFDSEIMLVLKDENIDDIVEYEATMIGHKIQDMTLHLDLDFKEEKRKATYNDIVVLCRSATHLITYKKIFDKINIPNLIVLTKGFFESPEIVACFSFLKAIDNCLDDISFTSVLKGQYAFSHFDENWLYLHKQEQKSIYESLLSSDDEKCINFINYYHDLITFSQSHDVYELFEKFLNDSQFEIFVSSLFNGKQRFENIQLFKDILKQDKHLSLHHIIDKIQKTIDLNQDYKPATLSNDGQAVTFMTIHHSKGLEFPVVFVNNLDHKFNFKDANKTLLQDKNFGIIYDAFQKEDIDEYKDVIVQYQNPLKGIFQMYLNNETINEEMRILYVALTRASQKMILTGHINDINQIRTWQQNIIDNAIDGKDHLLPSMLRKTNNMLDWIMLSIIRHPDFINQCLDLSLFDEFIQSSFDLEYIRQNALKINIYKETDFQDNTYHSAFKTSIISSKTIDDYTFNKSNDKQNVLPLYQTNKAKTYQSLNELDKSVAVTTIIEDGDRYYPDLHFDEETSSLKATDRGTIIHSILEQLPLIQDINLDK